MICIIEVIDGPGIGRRFWVASQRSAEIGRHSNADISIPSDRYLSRRHLLVHGEKEGFAVRDLKSVNGTFVNGERLDRCHLRTGDRIIAGETTLLVLLREDGSDPHQSDGLRFSEVLEPKLSPRVEDKVLPTTRKLGFQVFSSNS